VDHDERSQPYYLFDLGGSLQLGPWQLRAWIQNLMDRRYEVRAYYFANEPPAWEPKHYSQWGSPRTYAVQLAYEF